MKQEISAWISKAEGDWKVVLRESQVADSSAYNAVCFHAQQCIKKYLKARLVVADIAFKKTHDLLVLYEDIVLIEPHWDFMHGDLGDVSAYAVALRYPGLDASEQEAKHAIEFCAVVRKTVREALDLSND